MPTTDIIQTVGVIFSILLGTAALIMNLVQIKALMKQLKSSTSALIATRLDSLNQAEFDHPEVYSQLSKPYDPNDASQYQATLLMDMRLTLYQDVYEQHKHYGLLGKEEYETWLKAMRNTFQTPFARSYWQQIAWQYWIEGFRAVIDEIINEAKLLNERRAVDPPPNNGMHPTPRHAASRQS